MAVVLMLQAGNPGPAESRHLPVGDVVSGLETRDSLF